MICDFVECLRMFPTDSPLQLLDNPFPESVTIRLYLKRDDLLHPFVSGNKWRKLKYNLLAAQAQGFDTLLTFGGAYSNHLYATAAAGREFGFRTIGVVRGEELTSKPLNATLTFCRTCGMHLHFVSREAYHQKDTPDFLAQLTQQYGSCYVLPEGGTNELAIRGTAEILPEITAQLGYSPDYVCCPVGTGGTLAGLAQSAPEATEVMGFAVLKVSTSGMLSLQPTAGCCLRHDYHFGGYAKTTSELLDFIRVFEKKTGIWLEQVYTGKMMYGIYDLAKQNYFKKGATVVAVHTGGLQGRSRMLDAL